MAFLCRELQRRQPPAEKKPRVGAPDPTWVTSISQHSTGAISRHSPVRVFFTNDVIAETAVGSDASANIAITPAVKVKATFGSRREIVLRPETEFAPGTQYKVQVLAKGLSGLPAETKPFEFLVSTLGVNFDVQVHGLDVEWDRNELMTLTGTVMTADTEIARTRREDRHRDARRQTRAGHLGAGRAQPRLRGARHRAQAKDEQELVVTWNGEPLGWRPTKARRAGASRRSTNSRSRRRMPSK